ncbi:MAG: hypothetical protein ACYDEY_15370 [Acidimicrobiales bacterium]
MSVERSVYENNKEHIRAAVIAAASVIPPEGTDEASLERWSDELKRSAAVILRTTDEAAAVIKEITLTGRLVSVQNPVRRKDGTALTLAQVYISSDIGDPNKADRPWIDLRCDVGRTLAASAALMSGKMVRYRVRQVVEMSGGKPVPDGDRYATRTRLVGIERLRTSNGTAG